MGKKSKNPMKYRVIVAKKSTIIEVRYFNKLESAKAFVIERTDLKSKISARIFNCGTGDIIKMAEIPATKTNPMEYEVINLKNNSHRCFRKYDSAYDYYIKMINESDDMYELRDRINKKVIEPKELVSGYVAVGINPEDTPVFTTTTNNTSGEIVTVNYGGEPTVEEKKSNKFIALFKKIFKK